ncbi:MAG: hypothetical protein BA872_07515 [Desulfobacterales bacterium C00003060]|nr:MAG: hypothetical protein BA872_07515 [Desulfobacterales bacterium C00003060]OEU82470.1 MAG: hypothetical protein BA865_04635 [Desulfobacterales bacterium S5133MH4]
MKTLIGGAAAAILGIILLVVWWKEFLMLLAGAIPFALLSGGALAVYLGFDELKDTWKTKKDDDFSPSVDKQEIDKYKKEVDDLKKEVDDLKKEKK